METKSPVILTHLWKRLVINFGVLHAVKNTLGEKFSTKLPLSSVKLFTDCLQTDYAMQLHTDTPGLVHLAWSSLSSAIEET